ncbi:hypothetical protein EDD86DRAFT_199482 [Gorgonomyces haynaldii]|nr:hypothetical protein EDD86DRAFT_199482 [Gorgonomyces haynaldii]
MNRLPPEILLKIIEQSAIDDIHLLQSQQLYKTSMLTLRTMSLLNKKFHALVTPILWRRVFLDVDSLWRFILGLFASIKHDLNDEWCNQMDSLLEQVYSPPLENQIQESETYTFSGMLRPKFEMLKTRVPPRNALAGKGVFIQRLDIPSWDPFLRFISLFSGFLPNCKSLSTIHPIHGPEYIPSLDPPFLVDFEQFFSQLNSLSVDDVDADGWRVLVHNLSQYGHNIRVLFLEAIAEKDLYRSNVGMSHFFRVMHQLECLRLERLPIGGPLLPAFGGNMDIFVMAEVCTKLRAITLDYCDISMDAFYMIWNKLPCIEFVGVAGLRISSLQRPDLVDRPTLKTLRFVDCQVDDYLLCIICKSAPNLDMLRIVFEDTDPFIGNWNPDTKLTSKLFHYIAMHCQKLRILALSFTAGMTGHALAHLLERSSITTLDCHSTDSGFGVVDNAFLKAVLFSQHKLQVLNLYGQGSMSPDLLVDFLTSPYSATIRSLCLDRLHLPDRIFDILGPLRALSIVDCECNLESLIRFLNQTKIPKIYTRALVHPRIISEGSWFVNESLDIYSIWRAAAKHRS